MGRSQDFRRETNYFSGLEFQDVPDSFVGLRLAVNNQALSFFGAARLVSQPAVEVMRFGLLRRIVREATELEKPIQKLYKSWAAVDYRLLLLQGVESKQSLNKKSIDELRKSVDPAIFIVAQLERVRVNDYPNIGREVVMHGLESRPDMLDEIYNTYEHFLQSVHRPAHIEESLGNFAINTV